ncbi:MAG: hypothetical protein JXA33_28135 [Anaerolineae bacterium]|nr:hypothetical protein [Anaerolineae bacterium]
MSDLAVPVQFKGHWDHALILTYGADLPFFENALWQQFAARCRHKIILADGRQYLEACAVYAHGGLVRHLNQRYIAEGILTPRAAHAKAILLVNPEHGRLLVGSGNLGWQGYASGGELFTQYAYTENAPDMLNAFLAVRELVDTLIANHYITGTVVKRIRHIWEQTPWLFKAPVNAWQPVRHNLHHSFLNQLRALIDDVPVEELWVLAPFYDRDAVALEQLLTAFNPRQTTLLMQTASTSVDPVALQAVLARFPGRCRVCAFTKSSNTPYIHAKLYLFKLADRAICLQGSPNLSQVAMLRTVPQGNVEVANLLTGTRDAFDALINALDIQPELQIEALDLTYQMPSVPAEYPEAPWRLTGGEWRAARLILRYQGPLPDLQDAKLCIAGMMFALDVRQRDAHQLEISLPDDALNYLNRPVPVTLVWEDVASNPIFVCNLVALDRELELTDTQDTLPRIGDLDLDDEEFERLLGELDAALLIDRRSVWQLAGKRLPPASEDGDDAALRIRYDEIDYAALRQHPKIQQYLKARVSGVGYARTRLQIILSAITDHFRGLMDTAATAHIIGAALADLADETEDDDKKQRRRQTNTQRIRTILKNFIRRYLRGLRSADFLEIAGFEVVVHNYIIFSHVLWRLLAKDWVEHEFVLESFLMMWHFFWGDTGRAGYFQALTPEQQTQVLEWLRQEYAEATMLAALYDAAYLTHQKGWQDLRFALRDFWRDWLLNPPFAITSDTLEITWRTVANVMLYDPPRPTAIVNELAILTKFETRDSLLLTIEATYGYPRLRCTFELVKVWQRAQRVNCLTIHAPDALTSKDIAFTILGLWMQTEDLDYYRIHHPETGRLLFYDVRKQIGTYWATDRGEKPEDFDIFHPSSTIWEPELEQLQSIAERLDKQLTINFKKSSVTSCSAHISKSY